MQPFVDELSHVAAALSKAGQKRFSAPLHWVSLANGDADFHDNLIFFGFMQHQDHPALVAKVPRLEANGWMLQTEYDHLVELWNCLGSEALKYIPEPYGLPSLQGRHVLMLSYVPGESLTRLSPKKFWADRHQVAVLAHEAGRTLRDLNQLTEREIQPSDVLNSDLGLKADTFREVFAISAEEERVLKELMTVVEQRSQRATHQVLIQGDFWHGNMIRDARHGRLRFVDWQFARWSVDVSVDLYFFLLAGALSATEKGPAEERARQAFELLLSWRENIIPEYLAAYGEPDRYVLLPGRYGMLLCCVEKAVRPALDFGYSHADDRMWRYLFRELLKWPGD